MVFFMSTRTLQCTLCCHRNPDKTHLQTYLLFFTLTVGKLNDGLMHFQYSWSENLLRKHFCFLKYKAEVDQQCAVFFFSLAHSKHKSHKDWNPPNQKCVYIFFFLLKCCMEEFSFQKKAAKKHVTKTWFFIRNSNSP